MILSAGILFAFCCAEVQQAPALSYTADHGIAMIGFFF